MEMKVYGKKIRLAVLMFVLATALTLGGCGDKKSSEGSSKEESKQSSSESKSSESAESSESSESKESSGESAADPTPVPTDTPIPTPTPIPHLSHDGHEAKRELNCVKDKGILLGIFDAGKDRMLVESFVNEKVKDANGKDAGYKSRFSMVDTVKDEIIAEAVSVSANEDFVGARANGEIITYDPVGKRILLYSAELKLSKEFPTELQGKAVYDAKKDLVYMREGENIVSLDMDGSRSNLLEKAIQTEIVGLSYSGDSLIIADPGYYSLEEREYSLLETSTGKRESVLCADVSPDVFGENNIVGLTITDKKETIISSCNIGNKAENSYIYPGKIFKCCDSNVPVTAFYKELLNEENTVVKELILAKPEDGSYATDFGLTAFDEMYVAEDAATEHFYVLGSVYKDNRWVDTIYEICPECANYDKSLEKKDVKKTEHKEVACGEHLSEARKKADELEKEYGIEILIGNEFKGWTISDSFTFESTEDAYSYNKDEEAELYEDVLSRFSTELKKYPKDFFNIYKDYRNVGGFRLILVDGLIDNSSTISTVRGLSNCSGCWNNVTISVSGLEKNTIHHEIWHSVEDQIEFRDPDAFKSDVWNALNPKGFEYVPSGEEYMTVSNKYGKYILDGNPGEKDGYFARDYATRNSKEDRATLFEPVMTELKYIYPEGKYSSSKEYVMSFPGYAGKMNYLKTQYEKWFGKAYWE